MPIRPEHRFFYPIDWPQLSDAIRFRRAQGRCEECARPHLQRVFHLGDGRWWDAEISGWRDGQGRRLRQRLRNEDLLARIRIKKVVLAAAHRDHDTANNEDANLAAFCQRCHMLHDRDEHQRRRWRTLFQRKAICSRGRIRPSEAVRRSEPRRPGGLAGHVVSTRREQIRDAAPERVGWQKEG